MLCIRSSGLMYGSCYKKATDISHEQAQRNAKVRWPNSVHIQLWPTCCNPYWVYNHCLVLPNPEVALCSIPFLLCSTSFCIAHLSHDQRSFCLHPGSPLRQAVTKPKPSSFQMKQCMHISCHITPKSISKWNNAYFSCHITVPKVLNYRRMVSVALMNLL